MKVECKKCNRVADVPLSKVDNVTCKKCGSPMTIYKKSSGKEMPTYDDLKKRFESKAQNVVIISLISLIAIILLFNTFYVVNTGERGIVATWGDVEMTPKSEGLYLKFPFVQQIVVMDIKTQKYEAEASAASRDLQTVTSKIATNYHLFPEDVPILYKEIGRDYQSRVIQPLEQEIVKSITAKFTAEELITKREEVRLDIKNALYERLLPKGIIVEEVSIINFDFSPSFNTAIEAKVTAEQNSLAAKNKLEQVKFEAEQKVAEAKGKAEAISIESQALKANKDILQLRAIEKWDGRLPAVTGGAIPFINLSVS